MSRCFGRFVLVRHVFCPLPVSDCLLSVSCLSLVVLPRYFSLCQPVCSGPGSASGSGPGSGSGSGWCFSLDVF